MNESDIKKIIECHIEKIFFEIWKPIENKIRAQIHDVDSTLNEIDLKDKSMDKKYSRLRTEFRVLKHQKDEHLRDTQYKIDTFKDEVKDTIKLAVELGQKAQKLQLPMNSKIEEFRESINSLTCHAKAQIKKECDLRIVEILELKKKYEELLYLSNKALRGRDIYKNIEEPIKIIL